MDPYAGLDVVTAIIVSWNLQDQFVETDAIVSADSARMLFTKDIVEIIANPGDECTVREC